MNNMRDVNYINNKKEDNFEYLYGRNTIIEALRNNRQINKIYLLKKNSKNYNDGLSQIEKLSKEKKIQLEFKTSEELNEIIFMVYKEKVNHQGCVALCFEYKYYDVYDIISDKQDSLIIALDGLEDPHNLGAIVRTVEIANADGIILPRNRSVQVNASVSKVSTGAIEYVKVSQVTNLRETLKMLKQKGYWIVGAEYTEKSIDFWDVDYNMKICLVIGSEGKGISRIVREECDYLVKIPMWGKINSLNASVSAALLIYEIRRKQNKKEKN